MKESELNAILTGLGPGLSAAMTKHALAATAPLYARIAELEAKIAAVPEGKQGPQGIPGDPGPPVEMQIIENMIATMVGDAIASLPPPKDGRDGEPGPPGKDGESVTLQDVQPWISEEIGRQLALVLDKAMPAHVDAIRAEVAKAIAAIPVPRNGVDGKDGTSVTADDVEPLIDAIVSKKVAALPPPKEGAPGRDGRDVDIAFVLDAVQRAVDAIPRPRDGIDGFTPDDFDASLADDGRTIEFKLKRGEREITKSIKLALMQYRGIWREGEFEAGDVVTWGGSAFVAQRRTSAKPETDDSWKLCVKRGRDGKDGKNGERGERGLPAPLNGSGVAARP